MGKFAACLVSAGLLLVLLAAPARAQDVLTLAQATQQAFARNAALRASQAEVDERGARASEARAGWFPRVSVAESWQRGDQPVFVFSSLLASRRFAAENFAIDALTHPNAIGFHRGSFGIQQPIFDIRLGAEVEQARLAREVAQLTLDEARGALAVAVAETYGRVAAADATRGAADAGLQAARADRARAAARRDAGMATDADVLALDAHVAALVQRVIQADGEAAIARAELNRLTGAPIDRVPHVVDLAEAGPAPEPVEVRALLAEAEAARPALRRASVLEQLARSEGRLARAALLPRVIAQGGVEMSGNRFDDRASSWLVGAEMSWNLSLGGAERARLRATSHARTRVAAEADDARAAAHVEILTAVIEQRSAFARMEAGRAAVAQARESERIVRDRFDAGLASVTDLLRAQTAVLDAEAQRTAAGVGALISAAKLTQALGRQP
ncbi:MAG: TolC family protein [Acidobacteria bacterium]|nr:TolC family protein [Acidobacteriota bacterium]